MKPAKYEAGRDKIRHMKSPCLLALPFACLAAVALGAGATAASSRQDPAPVPAPKVSPYIVPADVGAAPADAEKTASGLASKVIVASKDTVHPKVSDLVVVHYTGWSSTGRKMVDSSYLRNRPATMQLSSAALPGWIEGIQLMVPGEKRRFWIPEALAYKGASGKPAGMLVFDIELLEITAMPTTPADVDRAPADSERNRSGIRSRVIRPGTGTTHPKGSATVTVNYTGWTTDGKMIDSSITRGQPLTAALEDMIPGWGVGVPLMVVGEKRRFWIPEDMAYKGQMGKPAGMLVFDIELLSFK
jgi:peptidylprolyl isomerase